MVTVAMHQVDLLPYSGFFHKMARADVFEVNPHFQYSKSGYQRRVKMRDQWAAVPLLDSPGHVPLHEVRIDPDVAITTLSNIIRGRYAGAKYWKLRGGDLLDIIAAARVERLWQFNLALMLGVRDMLGITTPIAIGFPLKGTKSEAVVHALKQYGRDVHHLSGPGARFYMDEHGEFTDAGITYEFTRHASVTGDSIVTVLMDFEYPLEVVMREEQR
jgi:hypothetical protein